MDRLVELDIVRIVQIHGPSEAHAISELDVDDAPAELAPWRLPQIGDTGAIIHLSSADGRDVGEPENPGTRYIVQGVGADGSTEWLAEFARGELELVRRPAPGEGVALGPT